jgi:hypothetical protein
MILKYLFDEPIADLDERMQKLASLQKRVDITAKIQGKEVGFYALLTFLQDAIDENERLFKESDRQLFEDILAHTISKKIRARIYHAEQWIELQPDVEEQNRRVGRANGYQGIGGYLKIRCQFIK